MSQIINYRITEQVPSYTKKMGSSLVSIVRHKDTGTIEEAKANAERIFQRDLDFEVKSAGKLTANYLTSFGRKYVNIFISKIK